MIQQHRGMVVAWLLAAALLVWLGGCSQQTASTSCQDCQQATAGLGAEPGMEGEPVAGVAPGAEFEPGGPIALPPMPGLGGQPVPDSIETLRQRSEDVYTRARASDWSNMGQAVEVLRRAVLTLPVQSPPVASAVPEINALIDDIEQAANAQEGVTVMRDANALSLVAVRLAVPYESRVPTQLRLMGYYARQLQIAVADGDKTRMDVEAVELRRTWDNYRPNVQGIGALDQSLNMDNLMARLGTASTSSDYAGLVRPIQMQVNDLERVFIRQARPR